MKKIITTLTQNYRARMYVGYAINITNFTYVLWKIFQLFMDETSRAKVKLFKDSYSDEIRRMIHPSQYLKIYGGELDNPTQSWPPTISSNIFTYDNKNIATEEEYHQMLKSNPYLVPSPELATTFKQSRHINAIPAKTYYFVDHIEERNIYNEVTNIKNAQSKSPLKEEAVVKQTICIKKTEEVKVKCEDLENADVDGDEGIQPISKQIIMRSVSKSEMNSIYSACQRSQSQFK
jgi:hypothetical protein